MAHSKIIKELFNKTIFSNSNIIHNNLQMEKDLKVSSVYQITRGML